MKKIYRVSATYEIEMYVLADSYEEAEDIAEDNVDEELRNGFYKPSFFMRVPSLEQCLKVQDEIPWGENPEDLTVAQIAAALIEEQREAEERARIEANQLKLPFKKGA